MPGSAVHEAWPSEHRGNPNLHPNSVRQGVTSQMRQEHRQLHWWYRSQEAGGWEILGPEAYYDD
jgi:hypothetical protein